jgi:hypothetical protein
MTLGSQAIIPPDAKNTPENIEPASTIIRIIAVIETVGNADRDRTAQVNRW